MCQLWFLYFKNTYSARKMFSEVHVVLKWGNIYAENTRI